LLARANDRIEYFHIASAATEIARQSIAYISFCWVRIAFKQINCGPSHSRSTDTALSTAVIDESLLHCVEPIAVGHSFNRFDCTPLRLRNGYKATINYSTVELYGASTTLPLAATFLGACQLKFFAQDVQQPSHRITLDSLMLAV